VKSNFETPSKISQKWVKKIFERESKLSLQQSARNKA